MAPVASNQVVATLGAVLFGFGAPYVGISVGSGNPLPATRTVTSQTGSAGLLEDLVHRVDLRLADYATPADFHDLSWHEEPDEPNLSDLLEWEAFGDQQFIPFEESLLIDRYIADDEAWSDL